MSFLFIVIFPSGAPLRMGQGYLNGEAISIVSDRTHFGDLLSVLSANRGTDFILKGYEAIATSRNIAPEPDAGHSIPECPMQAARKPIALYAISR